MGPHEPYWRSNISFSPPISRWEHRFQNEGLPFGEHRFQTEGLPYGSHSGVPQHGSSLSSNSKESGISMRDDHFPNHSASDGAGSYFSSPSDSFQTHQWMPSPIKGVKIDDFMSGTMREPASGPLVFTPTMEGTSALPYSAGSTSSRSDGSEYDAMVNRHASSNRSFSNRCSFMSKPIHPISFPNHQTPDRDAHEIIVTGNFLNRSTSSTQHFGATRGGTLRWSSPSSSIDFTDVSESLDSEGPSSSNLSEGFQCGLCDKFLSQRSPWSSRRIVRSGDMPVTGVLSCGHVFHADCLEHTTPKMHKHDPSCPLCARSEEINASSPLEQSVVFRLKKNGLPRLRPFQEDGSSRHWACGQVGDCVEGALHASPRNSMMLLNRSRLKKHLSSKGNSSKEPPYKLKKSGSFSSQLFEGGRSIEQEAVECSNLTAGPALKRW